MKIFSNPSKEQLKNLTNRPSLAVEELHSIVNEIFTRVGSKGDTALREYSQKFDKVNLQNISLSSKEIQEAEQRISKKIKRCHSRSIQEYL